MIPVTQSHAAVTPKSTTIGLVNHVLPQSFVDGPGNRVVVFLQGCNFHCLYCHNPFTINLCNSCGVCVPRCPSSALNIQESIVCWDEAICTGCDTCITVCSRFSSPKVKNFTPDQLWQNIQPSTKFVSGVSLSGGEPSLQINFLVDLFNIIKSNSSLTTLIETNGYAGQKAYDILLPYLDMVLVDLKIMDSEKHKQLTGYEIFPVLETIKLMDSKGKLQSINQVVVPGFHTEKDIVEAAHFLVELDPAIPFKLLRFRPHGTAGDALHWESPSDDTMDRFVSVASQQGLKNVSRSL